MTYNNIPRKREMHGLSNTPLYSTWEGMIQRCHNPNANKYADYGGRGIEVCYEWKNSFTSFKAYMGDKPEVGYTIDRIDLNKGYHPGNVKWVNWRQQSINKRKRANTSSIYRGVSFSKERNKYEAKIIDLDTHKTIHLGRFENEIEAAVAYDAAAMQLHDEYANTNLI